MHAHQIIWPLQLSLYLGLHFFGFILVTSFQKQKTVRVHRRNVPCNVYLYARSCADQVNCQLNHASLLKISSTLRTVSFRSHKAGLVSLLITEKSG